MFLIAVYCELASSNDVGNASHHGHNHECSLGVKRCTLSIIIIIITQCSRSLRFSYYLIGINLFEEEDDTFQIYESSMTLLYLPFTEVELLMRIGNRDVYSLFSK